jgi:preprotein translocase subunit SecE
LRSGVPPRMSPGFRPKDRVMATNPVEFINQTRAEIGKVVWPTRREVVLTTVMVLVLAALAAVFFSLVDLLIRTGLTGLLSAFGS